MRLYSGADIYIMRLRARQVMRMATPASPVVKERKISQSASSKIDSIIRQLFLPMLGMPTPERTSFLPEDAEDQILRQVAQERPAALSSEADFVDYMVVLYRKFQFNFQKEQCVVEQAALDDGNNNNSGDLDPGADSANKDIIKESTEELIKDSDKDPIEDPIEDSIEDSIKDSIEDPEFGTERGE